jgi:transposase
VTGVVIGIDPHKGSHTAVALDDAEKKLGQVRVGASAAQADQLVRWARGWPERTWAVEGAAGLGHLLARQLLAAGERVVDVQPKLAARVRLLDTGAVNKNDPNDARSVAIAALRCGDLREVHREGPAAVMKLWARRHRDLSRTRTRIACRLHAVLCELVPGGFPRAISAAQAGKVLHEFAAHLDSRDAMAAARVALGQELLEDLRGIDEQRRAVKRRLAQIVAASETSLCEIYGVGPIVAATVLGDVDDIGRFPNRDHFAAYNGTAPIEASSGPRTIHRLSRRGNRRLNHVIHIAAVTQIRHPGTEGRGYYDRKIAAGMAPKSALRALKRRISDALYSHMIADARRANRLPGKDPGGQSGNDSASSATGSHPDTPALRNSHSRAATNPTSTGSTRTRRPRRDPRTRPHTGSGSP